MSMDNSGPPRGGVNTGQTTDSIEDNQESMFASTPIWERRGKKRGFGRSRSSAAGEPSVAQEPRSFGSNPMDAPMTSSSAAAAGPDPLDAPLVGGPGIAADIAAGDAHPHHLHEQRVQMQEHMDERRLHDHDHDDDDDDEPLATPIRRERPAAVRTAKRGGPPAAALALGVLALGGLGAAGFYALQGDDGVPELTPGVDGPATVAAAPPMTEGTAVASARTTAPAMAEPARAAPIRSAAATERRTTTTRTAAVSRTRPALTARSASDAGISASGTAALPAGPQPYSSLNPDAPAATPPATQSTAPTTVNPAPTPAIPPVSPEQTPSTAPPQTPPETPDEPPPQA